MGALMPCDNSRDPQEEERLLFFPGKTQPWSVYYSTPNFLSPLYKWSPSLAMWGLPCGLSWSQTPNCNCLLIQNKPIFAREISGSLFVLGQYHKIMRHSLLYNNILLGHQLKKVTAITKKKLQMQKDLQTTKQHVLSILYKRTQSLNTGVYND